MLASYHQLARRLRIRTRLRNAKADFGLNFKLKWPDTILFTHKAFGDTLLLSAVARELAKRGIRKVSIATPHREMFANNPDIWSIDDSDEQFCFALRQHNARLKFLHYSRPTDTPLQMESPKEHIIGVMCREAGIRGSINLQPRMYLTKAEKSQYKFSGDTIIVQSSIANAGYAILNKEWYPERMQGVVDILRERFNIVQVGVRDDAALTGVTDLRGKVTVRQVACMLASAKAYIGMVGFLMHLARAVDCPSVIVYGGREAPWQTGYTCNENIFRTPECAPCWREDLCPYDRKCMLSIHAQEVVYAVERLLDRSATPVVDTTHVI